jgi:hypothetical protein
MSYPHFFTGNVNIHGGARREDSPLDFSSMFEADASTWHTWVSLAAESANAYSSNRATINGRA